MSNQNLNVDLKKDFIEEVLTRSRIPFITGKRDIHLPTISRVLSIDLKTNSVSTDSNTWFLIAAEVGMSILSKEYAGAE